MTQTVLNPMPNLKFALDQIVRTAISQVTELPPEECPPYLAMSKNPKFGDYQSNAMMALAKKLKTNPRELGEKVRQEILSDSRFSSILEKCELAGPGFLNLHLSPNALVERLSEAHLVSPLTIPASERKTVVVDYSSPNVAKEMHVGHIRSTILGDAIARITEHLGHRVIRQNHIGDWGTQFGMLIAFYRQHPERLDGSQLAGIEKTYREANELFSTDPVFEKKARNAVVELHNGDADAVELWERIVALSKKHLHENYQRLQINLSPKDDRGESFYNPLLSQVVEDLKNNYSSEGPVRVSVNDGAVCVFLFDDKGEPLFRNSEDEPLPFLIQKSDGAFLYATTDLAALRYRAQELKADWIIYVVDSRQSLHFDMLFATAQKTGFDKNEVSGEPVELQHVTFGTILGEDRKPLKTRDGGTVKLASLMEEAVERASERVADSALRDGVTKSDIAEAIGIGAIKYADLSQNRQTDYLFTWEKLLALEGNTAAYLMYAYARLSKMLRESTDDYKTTEISLEHDSERRLALALCRFPETLQGLTSEWRLNGLTDHLYSTASALMKFYDDCPVLKADDLKVRKSRLNLCWQTAQVLQKGLELLGIKTVEQM